MEKNNNEASKQNNLKNRKIYFYNCQGKKNPMAILSRVSVLIIGQIGSSSFS